MRLLTALSGRWQERESAVGAAAVVTLRSWEGAGGEALVDPCSELGVSGGTHRTPLVVWEPGSDRGVGPWAGHTFDATTATTTEIAAPAKMSLG